ncbi:MAG TPA: efflux RND transporter periplasmic adaptor subunit [Vicinamibacterales bacterium]|jgi:cobalt-zinc-cadmium efflux system membrane fusion protein|nr:efflux RND transporter periplasmic adaptor subunit [Vicinamibacterales bacterium]
MTFERLIVSLACASVLGCGRGPEEAGKPAAAQGPSSEAEAHETDLNTVKVDEGMLRDLRITTAAVESRPGGERIVLLGELAVNQGTYAEVGVPVSARVLRLLVNAGDRVQRGQTLAELTSPELGAARAEYLSAEARVKLADAALERKRGLATEKIVPLREVQEAESTAADARAALRSARATIGAFGVEPPTDDTTATSSVFQLRSPVAGSVIERAAVIGQMLDPATPAFRIGDLSTLWLTVHAFERDAVRIQQGVTARLVFPALPGQDFHGAVTAIGRHVERESRTVPVRIDVKNAESVLRPGMSATAALPVGATGAPILTVPVAAVQRVRNEWCVFLPRDASAFEIRRIGRGRDLDGEVEILSGLRAGEKIVVDGAFLLKAQAEKGQAGHDAH